MQTQVFVLSHFQVKIILPLHLSSEQCSLVIIAWSTDESAAQCTAPLSESILPQVDEHKELKVLEK